MLLGQTMLKEIGRIAEDEIVRSGKVRHIFLIEGNVLAKTDISSRVRNAVCLLATDTPTETYAEIQLVLESGATYLHFYGPDASRHHLEADSILVSTRISRGKRDGNKDLVPTTGEDCETLGDVVRHFLNCAAPLESDEFDFLIVTWGGAALPRRIANEIVSASKEWVDRVFKERPDTAPPK